MTLQEYSTRSIRTLPQLGLPLNKFVTQLINEHTSPEQQEKFSSYFHEIISKNDLKLDLSHMVHGLNSEIKELIDCVGTQLKVASRVDLVNLEEELGDIYWYAANYTNIREIPLPEELDLQDLLEEQCLDHLIDSVGKLTDIVKRFVAYNKDIDRAKEIDAIYGVCQGLKLFEEAYGLDGNRIRSKNINKLIARYPEKFTEEKALNRDLDAERKELEG